ncbi:MAG: hypothetical protein IKM61_07285 [Eubacteriaceae bacterium]|nr:hypothetical protein [Eubacteriaceae bacterium]
MKRVRSGCIFQTLVFSQKEDLALSALEAKELNMKEAERYKQDLENKGTRYQITEETVDKDGSVVLKIRKEYNVKTDVSEYFM